GGRRDAAVVHGHRGDGRHLAGLAGGARDAYGLVAFPGDATGVAAGGGLRPREGRDRPERTRPAPAHGRQADPAAGGGTPRKIVGGVVARDATRAPPYGARV